MAWLCVDKSGTENISQDCPIWNNGIWEEELGRIVSVPKGTIEKLIGRKLTHRYKPVHYEG